MASETDQIPNVAGRVVVDVGKTHSRGESDILTASSSSNEVIVKMANKTTPAMSDYWKKSTVTEVDRSSYHIAG
jgi:hypothetical protein